MRIGCYLPLTVENIKRAKKLGYEALEVHAGWLTEPGLQTLERSLPGLVEELAAEETAVTAVTIGGDTIRVPVADAVAYYGRAMNVARELGCHLVVGRTGRDPGLRMDENLSLYTARFAPIARMAADRGVSVALDPWPGDVCGDGPLHWENLATSPEMYDRLFDAVPDSTLGIEYDASHYAWQGIDYLQVFREYGTWVLHMRAKDVLVDAAQLRRVGVLGPDWWRYAIPGLGQIDWPGLFSVARQAGYAGDIAVENRDRNYQADRINEGLQVALKALKPLIEEHWPE